MAEWNRMNYLTATFCPDCGAKGNLAGAATCVCGSGAKRPLSMPSAFSMAAAVEVLKFCGVSMRDGSLVFSSGMPETPRQAHAFDRLSQAAWPDVFAEKVSEHINRAETIEAAARSLVEAADIGDGWAEGQLIAHIERLREALSAD